MWKQIVIVLAFALIGLVVARQQYAIRELRAALETSPAAPGEIADSERTTPAPTPPAPRVVRERAAAPQLSLGDLPGRVTALESVVSRLQENSEYLMARGQLPLAAEKIDELRRKLADATLPDRDRLQALRLLRRNNGMSDDVVQATLDWLQTSTNGGLREDLVQQLGGVTNAIVRDPLVRLATTDPNPDVREEAVDNLRQFVADPQVEALLWNLARNDADGGVREEAEDALVDGPMTEARMESLRTRALDPQSTLDERLLAVRALRNAREGAPDVTAVLAQFAQNTQDPGERARIFSAFDGSSDPNMKLPLVYGLQDPNPQVRERAADALSGYKTDPVIVDWLKYVAESDADPRVRREAQQALRDRR